MGLPGRKDKATQDSDLALDAIAVVLQRLWQTKMNSIAFIEAWALDTQDSEIEIGLKNQLVDERRHLSVIGEQLRARGAPVNGGPNKESLSRPFMEIKTRRNDYLRLEGYYHGIKEFTIARCCQLVVAVDRPLAQALDQIARDEQRHVLWAEVRLRRLQTSQRNREANVVLGKVRSALELVWGRSFRNLRLVGGR